MVFSANLKFAENLPAKLKFAENLQISTCGNFLFQEIFLPMFSQKILVDFRIRNKIVIYKKNCCRPKLARKSIVIRDIQC